MSPSNSAAVPQQQKPTSSARSGPAVNTSTRALSPWWSGSWVRAATSAPSQAASSGVWTQVWVTWPAMAAIGSKQAGQTLSINVW